VSDTNSIRIGTSAFTAAGWPGTFYPVGLKPAEYLSYYATKFDTVEVDSTFYRTPSMATVQVWRDKTPTGFVFAAKVPQVITHEKVLADCGEEFNQFVLTMDLLGDKLGPLLLQFGYFNKAVFPGVKEFVARLKPFLNNLPNDHKFVIAIRNKNWLVPQFVDLLRERGVALALIDQSWMPRPLQWFEKIDPVTADFTYVRLLGDRKEIEKETKIWNKIIVDRGSELKEWAGMLGRLKIPIYVYANNHYAGYGPATLEMFRNPWRKQAPPEAGKLDRVAKQGQLFK
jgi:uncharacterized protein YecE (DUF72 family)